jgi:myo-inositol-1(or 4)-monophosphatase
MSSVIDDVVFLQLISSVREAGALLMSMWPKRKGTTTLLAVNQKIDGSLVSAADMASNDVLTKALHTLYPQDFVFSEEVACEPEIVYASKRTWIIDPLDGTSAFLEGRDDFSVLVGLSVDHSADSGILFLPARDQLFTAQVGKGAFRNGDRICVSEVKEARDQRVYVRRFESTAPHLESPMMDSGLALAKVACGELDGAIIKMVTHREWDIAAPMAILKEAGATVTDEQGRAIPLGTGAIGFSYFVASNPHVHKELLRIIPL